MDKGLERIMKPKIWNGCIITLPLLGPYAHLLFDVLVLKDYSNINNEVLLSFPTLIFIGIYWCRFVWRKKTYKSEIREILSEMDAAPVDS